MSHYYSCIIAIAATWFFIWLLYPLAIKIGLIDHPGGRKQHDNPVPLIGGIAMFIGFVLSALTLNSIDLNDLRALLFALVLLVIIGSLDDRHDLPVNARFITQIIAALVMISAGKVALNSLGYLVNNQEIILYGWSYPITVLAVVGSINAVNMVDGIDGLAGSLSVVSFGAMGALTYLAGDAQNMQLLLIFISTLIPFLCFNLRIFGRKSASIFMGDAGSMFLGFSIAWFMISVSQGEHKSMRPVTALWIFAIPLLDTFSIMLRRALKKQSPFQADREHLHHIFQRAGLSVNQTLLTIVLLSIVLSGIGIIAELNQFPEYIMFVAFMGIFIIYYFALIHAWKLSKFIKKTKTNINSYEY